MDSYGEEMRKHVFTWKIENFSLCPLKKKGVYMNSPTFKANSFQETSFRLVFFPLGHPESDEGYASCFITREENEASLSSIECDYVIEIINKNNHIVLQRRDNVKIKKILWYGWKNYIKTSELLENAIYNDTLIIRCRLCRNATENFLYSQNTSTTKFENKTYHSFQWIVKDFNSIPAEEVVRSPCVESLPLQITLKIPEDYVKIFIRTEENLCYFRLKVLSCNIILLDAEGKERDSRLEVHSVQNNTEVWEFPTFIRKSQLNAEREVYFKDDCITLRFDITSTERIIVEDSSGKGYVPIADKVAPDTFASLNEDIKRMYEDKIHTDIKLKTGNEVFFAHKCILCARSPVFLAMFDNDMAESRKGEVDIPDLDAKTVNLFLEFIYTGRTIDLDCEDALKLIVAAAKYQVLPLKNMCAEFLRSILSAVNVCKILVIADLIQHDVLKSSVIDFIKMQPSKIFNSEEWKDLVKNNVLLAIESTSKVAILLDDQGKNNPPN